MSVRSALASLFTTAPAVGLTASLPPLDIRSPWSPDPSHLGHVVFGDVFGQVADDAVPMTRSQAMAVPTVRRARNIICRTLARLPIVCDGPTGPRVDIPWLTRPDPVVSRAVQVAGMLDDLLFYDVSYAIVLARGWDQRPTAFRRVEPWRVSPPDRGSRTYKVDDQPVDRDNVIVTDGLGGGGVLATSSTTLRIAAKLERAAHRVADNPVPAIELHQEDGPELDDVEIDELVDRWVDARRKGHGVGYTSRHVRANVLGSPAEHLLLGAREHQATDTARVMGVPADMVDAPSGSSMTYANVAQRNEFLIGDLSNLVAGIEARWSDDDLVPHGSTVRFDFDPLRRVPFAERMAGYKVAREAGVYSDDELVALERGRPLTLGGAS